MRYIDLSPVRFVTRMLLSEVGSGNQTRVMPVITRWLIEHSRQAAAAS